MNPCRVFSADSASAVTGPDTDLLTLPRFTGEGTPQKNYLDTRRGALLGCAHVVSEQGHPCWEPGS